MSVQRIGGFARATSTGSRTGANGGAYPRSNEVISSTVIRFHSGTAMVSIRFAARERPTICPRSPGEAPLPALRPPKTAART